MQNTSRQFTNSEVRNFGLVGQRRYIHILQVKENTTCSDVTQRGVENIERKASRCKPILENNKLSCSQIGQHVQKTHSVSTKYCYALLK